MGTILLPVQGQNMIESVFEEVCFISCAGQIQEIEIEDR